MCNYWNDEADDGNADLEAVESHEGEDVKEEEGQAEVEDDLASALLVQGPMSWKSHAVTFKEVIEDWIGFKPLPGNTVCEDNDA